MRRRRSSRSPLVLTPIVLAATLLASVARADITAFSVFKTGFQTQTGPNTLTPNGFAYDARVFFANAGEFTTGSLNYPGPESPIGLSLSGTTLDSGNQNFSTKAAMDGAFPFGTYTADVSGGTLGSKSVSLSYTADAYPTTAAFTASTFTALQGLDSTKDNTLNLVPLVPSGLATGSFIFLNIIDSSTNNTVFTESFLPSSTTSILLAANTLSAGKSYKFDLDYSDRIDLVSNGVLLDQGFDSRTGGSFVTASAVPEPGSLVLLGIGGAWALVSGLARRRRGTTA
jgi:hypothetical protein